MDIFYLFLILLIINITLNDEGKVIQLNIGMSWESTLYSSTTYQFFIIINTGMTGIISINIEKKYITYFPNSIYVYEYPIRNFTSETSCSIVIFQKTLIKNDTFYELKTSYKPVKGSTNYIVFEIKPFSDFDAIVSGYSYGKHIFVTTDYYLNDGVPKTFSIFSSSDIYKFYLPVKYGQIGIIKLYFYISDYHFGTSYIYEYSSKNNSYYSQRYNLTFNKSTEDSIIILAVSQKVYLRNTTYLAFQIENHYNITNIDILGTVIDSIIPDYYYNETSIDFSFYLVPNKTEYLGDLLSSNNYLFYLPVITFQLGKIQFNMKGNFSSQLNQSIKLYECTEKSEPNCTFKNYPDFSGKQGNSNLELNFSYSPKEYSTNYLLFKLKPVYNYYNSSVMGIVIDNLHTKSNLIIIIVSITTVFIVTCVFFLVFFIIKKKRHSELKDEDISIKDKKFCHKNYIYSNLKNFDENNINTILERYNSIEQKNYEQNKNSKKAIVNECNNQRNINRINYAYNINKENEDKKNSNNNNEIKNKNNSILPKINKNGKLSRFTSKDIQKKISDITRKLHKDITKNINDKDKILNETVAYYLKEIANISRIAYNKSNQFLKLLYNEFENNLEEIIINSLEYFKEHFSIWVKNNKEKIEYMLNHFLDHLNLSFINRENEKNNEKKRNFNQLFKDLLILFYESELSFPSIEINFDLKKKNQEFDYNEMIDILDNRQKRNINFVYFPSFYSNEHYLENGKKWVFTYINNANNRTFKFDDKDIQFEKIIDESKKFKIPTLKDKIKIIIKQKVNKLIANLNYKISYNLKKEFLFYLRKNKNDENIKKVKANDNEITIENNEFFVKCELLLMGNIIQETNKIDILISTIK